MSLKTRHVYEFENFRLDLSEKTLHRDGSHIALTPKVFETLQVLIENAGRLVEKDELMERLWPDRFVDETNLTFNIKMLRKGLGDDASNPRFIETVPRRGYRFIAETTEVFPEGDGEIRQNTSLSAESSAGATVPTKPSTWRTNLYIPALLLVLAIIFVVAGLWYLTAGNFERRNLAPILSTATRSESLSYSGSIFQPRISPDGKYLVYITRERNNNNVWLRELSTGTHFPLLPPSAVDYVEVMFSRNSDFVFFFRRSVDPADSGIYRISIFGGIPKRILSDTQGWFSLSPVDDQIAFVRQDLERRSILSIADSDGKSERMLAVRERPYNIRATRWAPDGKTIAAAVGQSESGANDFGLIEINVDSGEERELTQHKFLYIADLEWLPEKSGLLVAARENTSPNNQIWKVSLDNGETEKILDDGTSNVSLSLDKYATQMAVSQSIPDFHVTVGTLASSGNSARTATAATIASFTPSGKVVYATARGQVDLWIMNTDGTEQRQLTNHSTDDLYPLVSRDEKHVYFTSTRSGDCQIWRMNIDGSDQVQITKKEGGFPLFLAPDGRVLYFLSALSRNIWKVTIDGGEEALFFGRRVLSPAFSPNGEYFAFFYRDAQSENIFRIAIAPVERPTEISSFNLQNESAVPVQIAWAPDSRSFYYASTSQSTTNVWRQSLSARDAIKVREIGEGVDVLDLSVSPVDNKFAYVSGIWKREAKLVKGLQ